MQNGVTLSATRRNYKAAIRRNTWRRITAKAIEWL